MTISTPYIFPFGEPVRLVQQQDCTPKKVFVLGVYASAVHARWLDAEGRTRVAALAVASEPYIFWRGDGAREVEQAQPERLILLGDEPIRWFLRYFDKRFRSLSDFGVEDGTYGRGYDLSIAGYRCDVLPVVHPRQAGALGAHSSVWRHLHTGWMEALRRKNTELGL